MAKVTNKKPLPELGGTCLYSRLTMGLFCSRDFHLTAKPKVPWHKRFVKSSKSQLYCNHEREQNRPI